MMAHDRRRRAGFAVPGQVAAFIAAAFRYAGDHGAWSEGAGPDQQAVALEGLAGAYREEHGREVHLFAGTLVIASAVLLDLTAEIARQEGEDASEFLRALGAVASCLGAGIHGADLPTPHVPDDDGR